MQIGTILSELTVIVLSEVLASSWVPLETGSSNAIHICANFIYMAITTFIAKLAVAIFVEIADEFVV